MGLSRYRGSLPKLFPPEEESAHWLVRLAMVRHDLRFEVSQVGVPDEPTREDYFRTTYFLRRISISLLEAERILNHDLGRLLKRGRPEIPREFAAALDELRKSVSDVRPSLEEIRDVIGAHVRPKSDASGKPSIAEQVLRTHDGWLLDLAIDDETGERTDLHDVGMASFLFAWPDATDDAAVDARHGAYAKAITTAAHGVMNATDILLMAYWSDLGIKREVEG